MLKFVQPPNDFSYGWIIPQFRLPSLLSRLSFLLLPLFYAMLRYLVERLRVMVCPKWTKSLAQPIAVDDVVEYLIGCFEHQETSGKIFDVGGADVMVDYPFYSCLCCSLKEILSLYLFSFCKFLPIAGIAFHRM